MGGTRLERVIRPPYVHGDAYCERRIDSARTLVSVGPDAIAFRDAASGALTGLWRVAGGVPGYSPSLSMRGNSQRAAIGPRGEVFCVGRGQAWRWRPGAAHLEALGPAPEAPEAVALSGSGERFAVLWQESRGRRFGWAVRAWSFAVRSQQADGFWDAAYPGLPSSFEFDETGTSLRMETEVSAQSGSDFAQARTLRLPWPAEAPAATAQRPSAPPRYPGTPAPTSVAISRDGEWLATSDGWGRGDGDWTPWWQGPQEVPAIVAFQEDTLRRIDFDGSMSGIRLADASRLDAEVLPRACNAGIRFSSCGAVVGIRDGSELFLHGREWQGRTALARVPDDTADLAVSAEAACVFLASPRVLGWWRPGAAGLRTQASALPHELDAGGRCAVAISADGAVAALAGSAGIAAIDAAGALLGREAVERRERNPAIALCADGRLLAAGLADGSIALYRVRPFARLALLDGAHLGVPSALAFGAGRLVSAAADGSLGVWSMAVLAR